MHSHLCWESNIKCLMHSHLIMDSNFLECLDALRTRFSTRDLEGSVKQEKQ